MASMPDEGVPAEAEAEIDGPRAPPLEASDGVDGVAEDHPHDDAAEIGPSDSGNETVDPAVLAECAQFDHSDTDNGKRLVKYFGADLLTLEIGESKTPHFAVWRDGFWDFDNGALLAHQIGQKLGSRIGREADFLAMTPLEKKACDQARVAADNLVILEQTKQDWGAEQKANALGLKGMVDAARAAEARLEKRQSARRKFAVSSKNKGRIDAALHCAGACIGVSPDAFNPDPYLFATKTHTIKFARTRDDECPDPNVERWNGRIEAIAGHRREDMVTKCIPHPYVAGMECQKWRAFLKEFLPDEAARSYVQAFSGLGLLGRTVQRVLYHYGSGANGKSVFLETITRVLGPLAVGLPAESIIGHGERNAGSASPDLARLYGARFVRVLELPANKPLHEDLVKKLTGGEKVPVRTLFKGYFEFTPFFTCHLSGNGYPRIDGTDNGIWRRMAVVHWPVTIEKARQREFEDVLASFTPEYPGILNWLIEGALTFIEAGLHEPPSVITATQQYRSEMDPVAHFIKDCVERHVTHREKRATVFSAYESWAYASGRDPLSRRRFKNAFISHGFAEIKDCDWCYANCELHDVPARPTTS